MSLTRDREIRLARMAFQAGAQQVVWIDGGAAISHGHDRVDAVAVDTNRRASQDIDILPAKNVNFNSVVIVYTCVEGVRREVVAVHHGFVLMAFQADDHAVFAEVGIVRTVEGMGAVTVCTGGSVLGRLLCQISPMNAGHERGVGCLVAFRAGLRGISFRYELYAVAAVAI